MIYKQAPPHLLPLNVLLRILKFQLAAGRDLKIINNNSDTHNILETFTKDIFELKNLQWNYGENLPVRRVFLKLNLRKGTYFKLLFVTIPMENYLVKKWMRSIQNKE